MLLAKYRLANCTGIWQVSSCSDLGGILGWIDSDDTRTGHSAFVSRMKENVSTVVAKRAKLATTRNHNPSELVW